MSDRFNEGEFFDLLKGPLPGLRSSFAPGIIIAIDPKTNNMDKKSPNPTADQATSDQRVANTAAEQQAEKDISRDPESSAHSPNDDLDEGELARLGEDNNPVE